jgi:hypothetical protein
MVQVTFIALQTRIMEMKKALVAVFEILKLKAIIRMI